MGCWADEVDETVNNDVKWFERGLEKVVWEYQAPAYN